MDRTHRIIVLFALALTASLSVSCGRGKASRPALAPVAPPAGTLRVEGDVLCREYGIVVESVPGEEHAFGDASAISLMCERNADGLSVKVSITQTDEVRFSGRLAFDPQRLSVESAHCEDTPVFLGVEAERGFYRLALGRIDGGRHAEVTVRLSFGASDKAIAAFGPPQRPVSKIYASYYNFRTILTWEEDNFGDHNRDGEVSGLDVFPLASNFNKSTSYSGAVAENPFIDCLDLNEDGTIDGLDLFPVAANFQANIKGYLVYKQVGDQGYDKVVFVPIQRPEQGAFEGCRPWYRYYDIYGSPSGESYRVLPVDVNDTEGPFSQEAFVIDGREAEPGWPGFQGARSSWGFSQNEGPTTDQLGWDLNIGFASRGVALNQLGELVMLDDNGDLRRFAPDGGDLGAIAGPGEGLDTPLINADGRVFVSGSNGVSAFFEGQQAWHVPLSSAPTRLALDTAGRLYLGTADGHILSLSGESGLILWDRLVDLSFAMPPVISGPHEIAAVSTDGKVHFLDRDSGFPIAQADLGIPPGGLPALRGDYLFVGTGEGGVFRIDVVDHTFSMWAFFSNGLNGAPVPLPDGGVICADGSGLVHRFDETGAEVWDEPYNTGEPINSSPVVSSNLVVYIADTLGTVHALNLAGGTLIFTYDARSGIQSDLCLSPEGRLYFTDQAGWLYGLFEPIEGTRFDFNLYWNKNATDVDLHLIFKPEGIGEHRHIYFGSDAAAEEAVGLEFFQDNVEGLGPERLRLQDPPAGDYLLAAVYYDDSVEAPPMGEVEVELEFLFNGVLHTSFPLDGENGALSAQMDGEGDVTDEREAYSAHLPTITPGGALVSLGTVSLSYDPEPSVIIGPPVSKDQLD